MPIYSYRCKCGNEFDKLCKISEMDDDKVCPSCGELTRETFMSGAPSMGDAMRLGITRPDQGFQDVLRNIADRNPHSTIRETSRYI